MPLSAHSRGMQRGVTRWRRDSTLGLAKKSFGTFLSKGLVFLVGFPTSILVARFLGPEGKGLIYLLFTTITLSAWLGNLGLGHAAIYLIGKDRSCLPGMIGNILLMTGAVSAVLIGAGWLFLQYGRPDLLPHMPLWMWISVAFLAPLHLLRELLVQVLSAVLRIKAINVIEMTTVGIHLLLLLGLVVFGEQGVSGAFWARAVADIAAASTCFILVWRGCGRPAKPDWAFLRRAMRFGAKSYLFMLTRLLNLRIDAFFLTWLATGSAGVKAVGLYSVATSLAEFILIIPDSIRLSLFPMVASHSATGANQLTSMSCRHTMLLTMLASLGYVALGPFVVVHIYGAAFTEAITPLFILLPGVILLAQTNLWYSDLPGRGKPEVAAYSALIALIATVLFNLVLIPPYGIVGAAVASSCAYALEFVVAGSLLIRHTGMSWRELIVFRRADLRHYTLIWSRSPRHAS